MMQQYQDFTIRDWQPSDRQTAAELIRSVLAEYQLDCGKSQEADQDVWNVEQVYWQTGGAFWVVEQQGSLVGTAAFCPIARGANAVEIRKMYLLPEVRGRGLGRYLLQQLEVAIRDRGFDQIWLETATVLQTAIKLYESSGYQRTCSVEMSCCDRTYVKPLGLTETASFTHAPG